jgi:hypothetical protein
VKNIERLGLGLFACALVGGVGCTAEVEPAPSKAHGACFIGDPNCLPKPGGPRGAGGAPATNTAPGAITDRDNGAPMAPTTAAPGTAAPGLASDVPCDVSQVVSDRCTQCHAQQPKFGAMMPLTKLSDFHAPSKSDPKRLVYQLIPERINAQDATRRMPPASSQALSTTELSVLNDWVSAGAKANPSSTACAPIPGTGGGPTAAGPNTTGSATPPIDYNDPEMKCYRFLAHSGDKNSPHAVATTPDMYKGFTFMPPWKGMMYARSFKAIIDNESVIHHWLFFKNSGPGTDGEISDELGAHPDGQLVHGWAPGGDDLYLEPDVGQEMPGDVSYLLETHYNNTGSSAQPDASGVEVCVTPKPPAKVASLSWLGTDLIAGTTAEGTCVPQAKEPITIIGGTPHMHLKGRHMKVVINRKGGGQEILTDEAFDFDYQVSKRFKTVLMPGDTITTKCTYSEPATYGRGTSDEMCYLFTLYYPKLALTNGDPLGEALHGPDTCLPSSDLGFGDLGGDSDSDNPDDNLIPGVDIPFLPGI